MDSGCSHLDDGIHPLAEVYSASPKHKIEESDTFLLMEPPRKQQRVDRNLEALVSCFNGADPSIAPDISQAFPRHQELCSLSLSDGYPHELYPRSLYPPQQSEDSINIDHKILEIIGSPQYMQELHPTLAPLNEHQPATEGHPTCYYPQEPPSIRPGETQLVPWMPDSIPDQQTELYPHESSDDNTTASQVMGEPAAYIPRNPASTHDAILGQMSEVSPQTTLGDSPVGPLLEPDGGGLAPSCPGLDPSSPASGNPVYPNEMQGISSWPNANPCSWAGGELQVPLLAHQKQGIAWMAEMENGDHKGGILADDMGLGKTIQALALIESRPSLSPARRATLVVVPAALIKQWEHEIERLLRPHPGRYRVYTHYGNKKRVDFSQLNQYDIVLTSYGVLAVELGRKQRGHQLVMSSNTPVDGGSLSILGPTSQWHRVIFDEAQSIRNGKSKTAIACCDIDATYRWCLTGTHVKNYLQVLYSLLQFLRIPPRPELDVFDMVFRSTSNGRNSDGDARRAQQLGLETLILRRTRSTLIDGQPILRLPPTTTEDVHVVLSDMEQVLYTAIERSSQARFGELRVDNLIHQGTSHVRSLLQSMQQACCHPFLVPQLPQIVNDHCRARAGLEINASRFTPEVVHRLRNSNSPLDCPVCFDPVDNPMIFFPCGHSACNPCFAAMSPISPTSLGPWNAKDAMRCPLCRVTVDPGLATDYLTFVRSHYAPDQGLTEATGWYELLSKFLQWGARMGKGGMYSPAVGMDSHLSPWVSSSKIDKALEIIQRVRDQGNSEKIIIFSQFTAFLDLVEIPLLQRGWVFRRYHAGMSPAGRHDAVQAFTNDPDCTLMLVSFGAGYAGLNLTVASRLILMDTSWDPRVEELAVSRVWRVGQQKAVQIYRILASNTVDNRIIKLSTESRFEPDTLTGATGHVADVPKGSVLRYLFGINK